ncbi:MAG: amino acid ABC transporter permease [Thermoleophilia bacterium]|nr:amino acid ABC transporter permease [Thermoleophilia bacterium]
MLAGAGGRWTAALTSSLIALASTAVVVGLLVWLIPKSKGFEEVKATFFDRAQFRDSFDGIGEAFKTNIKLFMVVEAIVLVLALVIAVMRSLPGPVFFPVRALAVIYADVFRGIPTILLILLLGFGVPALQVEGIPSDEMFWGGVALVLVYSAYVSEVYRAGIDSVHPSQDAAARSLGLGRFRSLRHVVLPQAVRRVIPPLLNDFIGLQKDTALVFQLGVVEALNQASIDASATFNYTPYLVTTVFFLAITIPMTRLTDWLIARDRRRRQAGGAIA